eukprot:TRINITY_DN16988_c0_g1_i5.p1 TRINITY_DN16988_c0_g1~~TRINITY_DN16988_c0_g1_i5.p1  ORF type:complete len:543 (+),score=70.92 TRINITY_DN16988_c0_g1_i5:58-1686(+)
MPDADYIQERIGEIGRWQWRILAVLGTAAALGAWQTLAISFLLPEVDFKCAPNGSLTEQEKSLDPRLSWNNVDQESTNYQISEDQCTIIYNDRNESCTSWVYNETGASIVQEFNLVCSNDYLRSLSSALYMCGMMLGTLSSGVLSDLFGRKKVMIGTAIIFSILSCCIAAVTSMMAFIAIRVFIAASGIAMYTTCYVYAMEIIGGRWNSIIGIGFQIPWAVAYMILPGLAYALPYWAHLQIAISLPCLIYLLVLFIPGLVPESPKWLLVKGYEKEAEAILDKAAKMNNMQGKVVRSSGAKVTTDKQDWSYSEILRSPHTIVCALVMFYLWFTNSLVYYGMVLNSGKLLPGNVYINNFISGVLELVAYILTIVVFLFGGRRYPQSVTMILGGVALLLTLIGNKPKSDTEDGMSDGEDDSTSNETVKQVFGQLGKFAITASFAMVYLYAAELFPTVIRNSGMATSSFFARVGSVIAPFAGRELGNIDVRIPICLFAILSILAGILTLVLPETKDVLLSDTIKEGEKFIAYKDATLRKCLPKPTA